MKRLFLIVICLIMLMISGCELDFKEETYGFAREVSQSEQDLRLQLVQTAESYLGCNQFDGTHKPIIDLYNGHEPLAQGYEVQYTDQWCATFVSAVAIQCGLTDIIPTECGCQRQIGLFDKIGCWQEDDTYIPLPGDIIFYATGCKDAGDCTDWSNHVGIVVGTSETKIRVIEGNFNGKVAYHDISMDDPTIRGYGLPDFTSMATEPTE